MEPLDIDVEHVDLDLAENPMLLNVGPAHPAMHGTVRMVLELSGETILRADVQIGYLHRGFEKMLASDEASYVSGATVAVTGGTPII